MAPTSLPKLPGYLLHKPSGRARVRINGEYVYIGEFGSPESRQKYGELIADLASGRIIDPFATRSEQSQITIAELVLAYVKHAQTYYVKNGKVTDEFGCIKSALKPVVELYGTIPAADFGPKSLKAVRQHMVDGGKKCRRYINMSVGRIRRAFRYAVENELIEPGVLQKLEAIPPLLAGRTEAKDHPTRRPVPVENINRVKGKVNQRTRDMIDLMLLTGARPGELVSLTGGMIDRQDDVWVSNLSDHKTIHRGKERILHFGPRAQAILHRYLTGDPNQRLFPIRRATASAAIKKACVELGIPKFTSHWLRHTTATQIRKDFGLDVAQVILGHSSADVTQVYAEVNTSKARDAVREVG